MNPSAHTSICRTLWHHRDDQMVTYLRKVVSTNGSVGHKRREEQAQEEEKGSAEAHGNVTAH